MMVLARAAAQVGDLEVSDLSQERINEILRNFKEKFWERLREIPRTAIRVVDTFLGGRFARELAEFLGFEWECRATCRCSQFVADDNKDALKPLYFCVELNTWLKQSYCNKGCHRSHDSDTRKNLSEIIQPKVAKAR